MTISARPSTLAGHDRVQLSGTVENARAGVIVTIEARDCGQRSFREVDSARTREGGDWATEYSPGITTTLRAVAGGNASAPVTVQQRPGISLDQRAARRWWVAVSGRASFWRKRVYVQRYNRRVGTWTNVRAVLLTETLGHPGSGESVAAATFRMTLPKGMLVRALLPLAQARPCFVPGVSKIARTR